MLSSLIKKSNEKKKKKGFTLIELIIVLAIIAILIALAVPKFINVTKDAKLKADLANAKTIESAIMTAKATDKLDVGAGGVVNLGKLLQSVPKGKATEGTFVATFDEKDGSITVKIVKPDNGGEVTILPAQEDSEYAKIKD